MFNLLPDNFKKDIKAEYKRRKLIVAMIFVIFLQVSFVVFNYPIWAESSLKEDEAIADIDDDIVNQSLSPQDATSIASIITNTNLKLNIINTVMQYPEILPYIDALILNKTTDIHINSILYTANSTSTATMALSGVSLTREALVDFVKKLESSGMFKKVDLPVSNFAKDKNINFSISTSLQK